MSPAGASLAGSSPGGASLTADRLATVLSHTVNGVVVTDADGLTEWVNEAFVRLSGFTMDELRGRRPASVLEGPNADAATTARIRGHVARREAFEAEVENRHASSEHYWCRIEGSPLFDAAGAFAGYVAIETDVTERRDAHAALHASEARYRRLVEAVGDIVAEVDREGRWSFLNPAWTAVTGIAVDDALGQPWAAFVDPEALAALRASLAVQLRGRRTRIAVQTRLATASGEGRWVDVRGELVRDADGRACGFAGLLSDVTDTVRRLDAEREARQRAEELLRFKGSFLRNMSHEIRTPLTGILGFAELLAEEVDAAHRESVEIIAQGARRLHETLNSVLDLAQIESGTVALALAPVDVAEETADTLAILRPLAAARGLDLTLDAPAPVVALADAGAVRRVVTNLVGNAVKFTDTGGVAVSVRETRGAVVLRVADTGIGIPAEALGRVFGEFEQVSTGYEREREGNGLGLAITQQLVDLLGGTIEVESELGVGTTFTVRLPAERRVA